MSNDSTLKTLLMATGVCVVCSVLVSGAAIALKPIQDRNRTLDHKRNVLLAAGLLEDGQEADIDKLYEKIDARVIDLDSGEFVKDAPAEQFDLAAAERDPKQSRELPATEDIAGIRRRSNHQVVYLVREGDEIRRFVLPVHGKGLWSTMYGLVALDRDLNTVQSFAFFAHGETPGLGGRIDEPPFKEQFRNISIDLNQGFAYGDDLDAITGATSTSRAVLQILNDLLRQTLADWEVV